MNSYTVIGNLTDDVKLHSKADKSFITGTIADNIGYGENKKVNFVNFLWNNTKLQEYLVKGKLVFATGTIELEEWKDKDGVTRKSLKMFVRELNLVGGSKKKDEQESNNSEEHRPGLPSQEADEDIPF